MSEASRRRRHAARALARAALRVGDGRPATMDVATPADIGAAARRDAERQRDRAVSIVDAGASNSPILPRSQRTRTPSGKVRGGGGGGGRKRRASTGIRAGTGASPSVNAAAMLRTDAVTGASIVARQTVSQRTLVRWEHGKATLAWGTMSDAIDADVRVAVDAVRASDMRAAGVERLAAKLAALHQQRAAEATMLQQEPQRRTTATVVAEASRYTGESLPVVVHVHHDVGMVAVPVRTESGMRTVMVRVSEKAKANAADRADRDRARELRTMAAEQSARPQPTRQQRAVARADKAAKQRAQLARDAAGDAAAERWLMAHAAKLRR